MADSPKADNFEEDSRETVCVPKLTVAGKPPQFRQDVPVTLPWVIISHSDIGIATHCNWLNLMQWLSVPTLKMYLRNLRKIPMMATLTKPLIQTLTLTWIPTQIPTQIPNPNPNAMKET